MPVRKVAIMLLTLMLIHIATVVSPAWSTPAVVGRAAVLIDSKTGKVLYNKNGDVRMAPASTTKVLTAAVALEEGKLDDIVTVSKNASSQEGSSIYSTEGEKFTLEQLLYALLLESANDSAVAIAEHIAGSVEKFTELMNAKAREWGARNSNFENPNGLPDPNHYVTAYDLAQITRHAMTIPKFREITATEYYDIPRQNPLSPKRVWNHNKLIRGGQWYYKGANGGKTGYTREAKQCLVSSASRDGQEFIAVVLGSEGNNIWTDSKSLLDFGFANFRSVQLVAPGTKITEVPVKSGVSGVRLITETGLYYTAAKNEQVNASSKVELFPEITAPIAEGQKLGEVRYFKDGRDVGAVSLVAAGKVNRKPLAEPSVIGPVFGGAAFIGLVILFSARRRKFRRRYRKSMHRNLFR